MNNYLRLILLLVTITICGLTPDNQIWAFTSEQLSVNHKVIDDGLFLLTPQEDYANVILIVSNGEAAIINTGISSEDVKKLKLDFEKNNIKLKYILTQTYDRLHTVNIRSLKVSGVRTVNPWLFKDGEEITVGNRTMTMLGVLKGIQKLLCIDIDGKVFLAGTLFDHDRAKKSAYKHWTDFVQNLLTRKYQIMTHSFDDPIQSSQLVDEYTSKKLSQVKYKVRTEGPISYINDDIMVYVDIYGPKANLTLIKSGKEVAMIDVGSRGCVAGTDCNRKVGMIAIKIREYLDQQGLKLKHVFITHFDYDHNENRSFFNEDGVQFYDYTNVKDNQIVEMGDKRFRVIFTDGHKNPRHHISVVVNDEVLIAGDALVQGVSPLVLVNDVESKKPKEIFKNTLESLRDSHYSLIIPGHGSVYVDNALIDNELKVFYKILKQK